MRERAGAHVINTAARTGTEVFCGRDGNRKVDFVISRPRRLAPIEVGSGWRKGSMPGMAEFLERYPRAKPLLVGAQGIALIAFLGSPSDA